jgi:hypothetical protein
MAFVCNYRVFTPFELISILFPLLQYSKLPRSSTVCAPFAHWNSAFCIAFAAVTHLIDSYQPTAPQVSQQLLAMPQDV